MQLGSCGVHSNFAVLVFKTVAYLHTGSAAMLSEAIHSLADMLNQVAYTSLFICTLSLSLSLSVLSLGILCSTIFLSL